MGDIIHYYNKNNLSNEIKSLLIPSINVLFNSSTYLFNIYINCKFNKFNKYELQQLFITLNPSEKFIYKKYYDDYEKYYKFKGVV